MKQKARIGRRLIRLWAVISALCLIISLGAVTVSAQGTPKITVSAAEAEKGMDVSVSVKLEENPGIWGLKLRIKYDQSVLTLKSVAAGNVFSESELMLSEKLSADPFVVLASANQLKNKTADGTIITLNFSVSSDAAYKSYPISVEVVQANNVDGQDLTVKAENGKVAVVGCVHSNKAWETTKKAECEAAGQETLTCQKCRETFETRELAATGHKNTEIKNAVAVTETAEGYTGDTYCKDCGNLIKKGEVIAKSGSGTATETTPADTETAGEPESTEAIENTEAMENTEGTEDTPEASTAAGGNDPGAAKPDNKPGVTEPVDEPIKSMTAWVIIIAAVVVLGIAGGAILCIPRTRRGKK